MTYVLPSPPIPRPPLPPWVRTLTRYGQIRVYRVPGAAIAASPPRPVIHVQPLTRRQKILAVVMAWQWVIWLESRLDFVIERQDSFAGWWASTADAERRRQYHGRRRLAEREWWAKWPTQWWPTLATSGNAWDVLDQSLLNECTSQPEFLVIGSSRADHS